MHCRQCRSACHVDRHRGTLKTKRECDPPGGDACGRAEDTASSAIGVNQLSVFTVADSGVHSCKAATQSIGGYSRVFKSFPACFKHHPLSRVHHARFDGRDSEEARVEPLDAVHERAANAWCVLNIGASVGNRIRAVL